MISIIPMSENEFEAFKVTSQKSFAEDLAKSQNVLVPDALKNASEQFARLVPDGTKTPGQLFFNVALSSSGQSIGFLWLGLAERLGRKVVSINDIFISKEYRGHGFGKQAMTFVKNEARKFGAKQIRLHVFQHNEVAKSLYEGSGFSVSSIDMLKDIG